MHVNAATTKGYGSYVQVQGYCQTFVSYSSYVLVQGYCHMFIDSFFIPI
jgi:hypothetical protein